MKRILAVLLAVMLLAAVVPATSLAAEAVSNGCDTKVYRTDTLVTLRASASNSSEAVASLCCGTPVKFVKQSGSWYKVKTFHGVCGWVKRCYLSSGAYAKVNTRNSGLNYRKGPSTCYAIKGSFPKGTKVLVKKIHGNWAYASKGSKCGWCCRDYLKWVK